MAPNTQSAAQYGVNPYERRSILLGPGPSVSIPDRSNGQFIEQLEGSGFYVERADFPVLCNIGSQGGGVTTSICLRDGKTFKGNFKGLTLTHPALNVQARLDIILLKGGAEITNQLDDPIARLSIPFRAPVLTATEIDLIAYVPPGVRGVKNLQVVAVAAAGTGANAFAVWLDANGQIITPPTGIQQNVAGVTVTYNQSAAGVYVPAVVLAAGTLFAWNFPPLYAPVNAVELKVVMLGTGLGAGPTLSGNYE